MSRLARLHIALLSLSASSILRGSQRCLAGITVVLSELPFTLFLALTRTRMWDSALLGYMCARVFHHLGTADGTTVALPPVAIPHFKNTILHFLKKKKNSHQQKLSARTTPPSFPLPQERVCFCACASHLCARRNKQFCEKVKTRDNDDKNNNNKKDLTNRADKQER